MDEDKADWRTAVAQGDRPPRAASPKRFRILQQGRLVLEPDILLPCIVRDLSPLGAKVWLTRALALPDTFTLLIAGHELRTHRVALRWQRGDFAGLVFVEPISSETGLHGAQSRGTRTATHPSG